MSQKLKRWAMSQPDYPDPDDDIYMGRLEEQLPRVRKLREELRDERKRDKETA